MAGKAGEYSFERKSQCSLRSAIRLKNKDLVLHLVKNGAPVNNYSSNLFNDVSPLHLAVISRSPDIVKILLDGGANVNFCSLTGDTPLTLAAKVGDQLIIDLLLSDDVQNEKDPYTGLTHLHIACMRNNTNIVHKLLLMNRGENINAAVYKNSTLWAGYTPLHFAVYYQSIETVQLLLSCKADITAVDTRQMTALHLADFQYNYEIMDLILEAHKYVFKNPTNKQGLSHFHIACTRDNPLVVEHFLKLGVDVDLPVTGVARIRTPIDFATCHECPNVVRLLLEVGAHLRSFNVFSLLKNRLQIGNNQIYDVISLGRMNAIKMDKKLEELTDFHRACTEHSTKSIKKLLSNGDIQVPLDFNESIWNGYTPAHLAVCSKSNKLVKFLIENRLDFTLQDYNGKTPLHVAFEYGQTDMVYEIIKSFGGCIQNSIDDSGLSVFHILCSTDRVSEIETLLSQGVDVDAQVGHGSVLWAGCTPMHFAVKFLQQDVVSLLLKHNANISIGNILNLNPYNLLIHGLGTQHDFQFHIDIKISEILITIYSSRPREVEKFNITAVSPLHALCMHNNKELLQEYLTSHVDEINKFTNLPISSDYYKYTALHLAAEIGLFDQARMLLEKGADPLLANSFGKTFLECTKYDFWYQKNESDAECLFSLDLPIEIYKSSHFHLACRFGFPKIVRRLLDKATLENLKMKFINCLNDGETPLHSVITAPIDNDVKSEITHILLENGSDVNAKDFKFQTPLHRAEMEINLDIIRTLISYGADVNAQNSYGETVLHMLLTCPQGNHKERLVLYLENGADINIVDEQGRTCLMERFQEYELLDYEIDESFDCYIILLEQVTKLRVIGYHISDIDEKAYTELRLLCDELFDEAAFIRKCAEEFESMDTIKIDSCTKLQDILLKSPSKMVSYSHSVVLQSLIDSREFYEKFPIYGCRIRLQFKMGKTRGLLLKKFAKSFLALSRKSLPSTCLEMIVQYLSNVDLHNFIVSSKRS
ncbi:hypothetical protein QAD02_004414 [Eretmocerus hayati]|uniref:Uncharacterized protein n=1 Tax=Eretmocerus hayati TaxID=131215 RepID=A0ACC2NSF0_9HYME|nr:hypothetical protein QAD02_004414 [Eretmocerus hayati]